MGHRGSKLEEGYTMNGGGSEIFPAFVLLQCVNSHHLNSAGAACPSLSGSGG